jgi:hypothetical protein
MHTKFIRQGFDFSIDSHPGDRAVEYDWDMLTMAIFRKRATHQTLGRDFLRIVYDDESPSHLIVHFAGRPGVNLVTLSSAVERLLVACRNEAKDELEAFDRRGLAEILGTAHFSLTDARRLPSLPKAAASEAVVPSDAGGIEARHALLRWMRDTTWRWHPDGLVRHVHWLNHPNSKVPAVASCGFSAPYSDGDTGRLELLIARYQRALGMELNRLSRGHATSTQPTPWP